MKRLGCVLMLAAAGCSQVNGLRTDLSARPASTGTEEHALIGSLMMYAYDRCAIDPQTKVHVCDAFHTADGKEVKTFVEAGMTLSDYYCDRFFRAANQSARKRRFARGATNDVGGIMATILGLASAGSAATGGVAAAFSFADSSFRNYDESFMVDADLAKMRRLVLSAQDNMKKAVYADMPTTYLSSESVIIRYAGLCSFLGMQDLLNDSIAEKTKVIEAQTGNAVASRQTASVIAGNATPAAAPALFVKGLAVPAAVMVAPEDRPSQIAPPPPPTR